MCVCGERERARASERARERESLESGEVMRRRRRKLKPLLSIVKTAGEHMSAVCQRSVVAGDLVTLGALV